MASLKDVQDQISGVKKTKQITKAMNMVASAKLRGAQTRIERFKPYANKFYDMLSELAGKADSTAHPLLEVRDEVKTTAIVLVTSDRGLCGSFNANILSTARKLAAKKADEGKTVKVYCVGKKARDFFKKTDYEIMAAHADVMGNFDFSLANSVGMDAMHAYTTGEVDEVILIYGEFISTARQAPATLQVLPIAKEAAAEETAPASSSDYIYEPEVEGLLAELLPRFVKVQIYRGLLDTSCAEHAARMAAMDNATRACDDMTESLTLLFNKTRQAAITTDLMTIVGGAEALKG